MKGLNKLVQGLTIATALTGSAALAEEPEKPKKAEATTEEGMSSAEALSVGLSVGFLIGSFAAQLGATTRKRN